MRHVVFCGDKELYYHDDGTFGRININLVTVFNSIYSLDPRDA